MKIWLYHNDRKKDYLNKKWFVGIFPSLPSAIVNIAQLLLCLGTVFSSVPYKTYYMFPL